METHYILAIIWHNDTWFFYLLIFKEKFQKFAFNMLKILWKHGCVPLELGLTITFPRQLIRQEMDPLAKVYLLSLSERTVCSKTSSKNPFLSRPLVRCMQPKERIWNTVAEETCGMSLRVSACLSDSQAFHLDQNIRRDDALVSHLTHSLQFKEDSLGFPSLFILRGRNYRVPAGHCAAGYVIQRQILE